MISQGIFEMVQACAKSVHVVERGPGEIAEASASMPDILHQ
jgi:hypothetical protein